MVSEQIEIALRSVIGKGNITLHEPSFDDKETASLINCIKEGYVSSVGQSIEEFEGLLSKTTGAKFAVALVNGTSALHLGLLCAGVEKGDEVLVPALTFVGSANAICHAGATPHFIESESYSFGIDVVKLEDYLTRNTVIKNKCCWNIHTNKPIRAIMPVHVFGHIGMIVELCELAKKYYLEVIEDAAEALGSYKGQKHAGTFGKCGILSFNGNKIITTGGGGAVITDNEALAKKVRHLSQNAKVSHSWEYWHDEVGYNARMPALNAALGIAQLHKLSKFLKEKQKLMGAYANAFEHIRVCQFFLPPKDCKSNNWLNAILLHEEYQHLRDKILVDLNKNGLGCRPVWSLLSDLPHFNECPRMHIDTSRSIATRLINIPSSSFLG
jgi:perosamine synthetase